MKKALIVIDFVNDFVATDGSLTCGDPAQKIDNRIAALVTEFSQAENFIVAACDSHSGDDIYSPEHRLFPIHCVEGSHGSLLFGETAYAVKSVPKVQLISIRKQRYSAFAGTELDLKLRERGVTEVFLTGVCSDICVLHTAIDAYNLGYSVNVYESAIASFNAEGHSFALGHFKNVLGAKII